MKEVFSPSIEISYPDGSRASDVSPSSEMYSSSTDFCVSPDVMEGSSAGDILKPAGGAVFVCTCSFLPIWRDILAMGTVPSFIPCARA